jgi:hypothetical protein
MLLPTFSRKKGEKMQQVGGRVFRTPNILTVFLLPASASFLPAVASVHSACHASVWRGALQKTPLPFFLDPVCLEIFPKRVLKQEKREKQLLPFSLFYRVSG